MNLHEFQAKELLTRFGVPVPKGRIADSGPDGERIARRLQFKRFAIKAQVHASDRARGGGIRFSASPEGVGATAELLLGSRFTRPGGAEGAERVRWVLIEEAIAARQLLYAAIYLDSASGRLMALAGPAGGEAIERRVALDPTLIERVPLTFDGKSATGDFAGLVTSIGLSGKEAASTAAVISRMADLAVTLDATQVEINPLALTWDGELVAMDAKITIDNHALIRHPGLAALSAAVDVEEGDPVVLGADRHHINYQRMGGDVGVVVNGAGLALATVDLVGDCGGRAANFMDVRTTATSLDVAYGMELILSNSAVRSIIVNVHGGGMQPCDTIAEGVGMAMRRADRTPPLVIRMAGNNAAYAHTVLANLGVGYVAADDMGEAAKLAVAAARSNA
ncbi:MAG: ATP-grasp domain-containing protein [Hyphomicrobiaceae bacterium]